MWGPGSRISYQSAAHACPTVARATHVPARGTQFLASRQQHGPRNGCSLVACSTAPSGYFQCFVKIVTNMVCKKQHLQVRSCISIISCIYEPFAFLILWTAGFLTGFFFFLYCSSTYYRNHYVRNNPLLDISRQIHRFVF